MLRSATYCTSDSSLSNVTKGGPSFFTSSRDAFSSLISGSCSSTTCAAHGHALASTLHLQQQHLPQRPGIIVIIIKQSTERQPVARGHGASMQKHCHAGIMGCHHARVPPHVQIYICSTSVAETSYNCVTLQPAFGLLLQGHDACGSA